MPFIPCPGVAETEVRMLQGGKQVENVLHWRRAGDADWDAASIEALAERLLLAWADHVLPVQCTGLSLSSILAKSLDSSIAPFFEAFPLVPVVGTLTGPAISNNVALCLTKRSGLTGRSARGRLYHIGFTEDQMSGNTLLSAYVSDVVEAYQNMIINMAGSDFEPVILSKYENNAPRTTGIFFLQTTIGARNNRVDTQRRRLPDE